MIRHSESWDNRDIQVTGIDTSGTFGAVRAVCSFNLFSLIQSQSAKIKVIARRHAEFQSSFGFGAQSEIPARLQFLEDSLGRADVLWNAWVSSHDSTGACQLPKGYSMNV